VHRLRLVLEVTHATLARIAAIVSTARKTVGRVESASEHLKLETWIRSIEIVFCVTFSF
jgi:hypothetical protein